MRGIYRGMSTPLVLATPASTLFFMGNDYVLQNYSYQTGLFIGLIFYVKKLD